MHLLAVCEGNALVTGGFLPQQASDAVSVSMSLHMGRGQHPNLKMYIMNEYDGDNDDAIINRLTIKSLI